HQSRHGFSPLRAVARRAPDLPHLGPSPWLFSRYRARWPVTLAESLAMAGGMALHAGCRDDRLGLVSRQGLRSGDRDIRGTGRIERLFRIEFRDPCRALSDDRHGDADWCGVVRGLMDTAAAACA